MTLIDKTQFDYKLSLGAALPSFSLPATDGKTYTQDDFKPLTVILFSCNHCPYVHGCEDALQALVNEHKENVDVVAINSNEDANYPEDSFANMQKKEVNYYYLRDESQEIAKAFGGECTPHFFVFKDKQLVYQGRLNDAGQDPAKATTHELQDALQELVAGKEITTPLTAARGCSIKWK